MKNRKKDAFRIIPKKKALSAWTLTATLQRGKTHPTPNDCPRYDTKQSDGEVPVRLELWGMRSTPSLPLFPGPLWLEW